MSELRRMLSVEPARMFRHPDLIGAGATLG